MLAQMLQMQFDREFDDQLLREEKKFNGGSKGEEEEEEEEEVCYWPPCLCPVSISFENYRMVHPYADSDSSEDEVDWQDTRDDPYRAGTDTTFYLKILQKYKYFDAGIKN